jgi:hypothetical protein
MAATPGPPLKAKVTGLEGSSLSSNLSYETLKIRTISFPFWSATGRSPAVTVYVMFSPSITTVFVLLTSLICSVDRATEKATKNRKKTKNVLFPAIRNTSFVLL